MPKADSDGDPVVGPVIHDKRGKSKPITHTDDEVAEAVGEVMPTAEELLADGQSTFEQQAAEEAQRLVEWEAMTDDEKQAVLAQQAAEVEGTPFAGGGIQTPPSDEAGKKKVLTMFTIVVHLDGTAVATNDMDTSQFDPQYEVDASKMYRAVCEIKKDIESTDAAAMVLRFMNQQVAALQQQQQADALAGQLGQRGLRTPTPPPRGKRR